MAFDPCGMASYGNPLTWLVTLLPCVQLVLLVPWKAHNHYEYTTMFFRHLKISHNFPLTIIPVVTRLGLEYRFSPNVKMPLQNMYSGRCIWSIPETKTLQVTTKLPGFVRVKFSFLVKKSTIAKQENCFVTVLLR